VKLIIRPFALRSILGLSASRRACSRDRQALINRVLCVAAVGVGAVAGAIALRHSRTEPAAPPNVPSPEPAVAAATAPAHTWSLRTGGWTIRVDGAEIPIPSLAEQTASRPRASLALSISPFDRLILHHAKAEGFDWRLIAALIYEESRFKPDSVSDKGAVGLMQVRPIAAQAVGAEHFAAPAENIQAGVRYLHLLEGLFPTAQGRDQLSLVLAAYNIGPGHVRDAQALARRFGYDPNRWEDGIDLMLPLLEQPTIHRRLPHGFGKGSETVAYVQRILERYRHYQIEQAADVASAGSSVSRNPG
jgi:soluble lytic murein transglycosylase-like protein